MFCLKALKFDPQYYINIQAMKPLGISLVENEEGGNLGNEMYDENITYDA